jgi:hypothetical protein
MNVEIGAEATLFTEKEYISGIFVADVGCAGISKALLFHSSHPIPHYIENRSCYIKIVRAAEAVCK